MDKTLLQIWNELKELVSGGDTNNFDWRLLCRHSPNALAREMSVLPMWCFSESDAKWRPEYWQATTFPPVFRTLTKIIEILAEEGHIDFDVSVLNTGTWWNALAPQLEELGWKAVYEKSRKFYNQHISKKRAIWRANGALS